nr:reverse transcriptase domain-containing protein [Tanacetum cinerariifolium]
MEAPIISISLDSSEESVGSHASRVIFFGTIHAIIPVIPEVPMAPADLIGSTKVGAVYVSLPTGVLDLVDYSSSSDSDPLEDSLPVAPELPLVSPFFCFDDLEADSESEPAEQRPERHESLTPSSKFPLAPVISPPEIHKLSVKHILNRLNVSSHPAHRLAWRRVSHRSLDHHSSPDFTSDSSCSSLSSDSSSDISLDSSSDSLSYSSLVHSSSRSHSRPTTRVTSHRLVDPSVRTPRCSEDFMHWRSAPLSTLYPSTTSDLSPDSSSERAYEDGTADAETVADLGISEGVGAYTEDGIYLGVEVATSDIREDGEEFKAEASEGGTMEIVVVPLAIGDISEPTRGDAHDLEGALYDISHYMFENLTVKNDDLAAYTQRFQELTMLCTKMVPEEEDRVEKFIGGLLDSIQGNGYDVKTLRTKESSITAKRTTVYNNHHLKDRMLEDRIWKEPTWLATMKGEYIMDHYLSTTSVNFIMKMGQVVNQRVVTCYECGRQGHYRNDFPKLKDQNCRNKTGNKNGIGEARGKAYVLVKMEILLELTSNKLSVEDPMLRAGNSVKEIL